MNWDQLQAIVWLRWRLTWNRFVRAGSLNAIISVLIIASLTSGVVVAGIGGVLAGLLVVAKQPALILLIVWDGIVMVFLLFWLAGLLAEIQRAESIDLSKLMHLPLTLRQVFVFNYLASHFSPGILLFMPGMLGLSLGLALGTGIRLALMIPLVIAFLLMLTSWTYCLRGWLSALMVNKRRRRAIIMWVTLVFVLIFQLPGIIINSTLRHSSRVRQEERGANGAAGSKQEQKLSFGLSEDLVRAHLAVPLGWPGYAAMTLKQRSVWPSLGTIAASSLLAALGLMRSYRSTLRFYQGAEEGAASPRTLASSSIAPRGVPLVERTLPGLPDDTAALTLAMLRSLLRAPEMKMSLIMPIVAGAAFSSMSLSRIKFSLPEQFSGLVVPVVAILAIFSFAPIMANAFGLDRNAFRGLVLLPTRRDQILLAKNLAFFPLVGSVGMTLLVLACFIVRISPGMFVSGLVEIAIAFFLFTLLSNMISILAPYRTAPGTLQAKKPKPVVFLAVGLTMLGVPLVLWPVVVPSILQLLCSFISGVPAWLPVNFLASLIILFAVAWLYRGLLPAQGRLLQRREQRILVEVTEDLE